MEKPSRQRAKSSSEVSKGSISYFVHQELHLIQAESWEWWPEYDFQEPDMVISTCWGRISSDWISSRQEDTIAAGLGGLTWRVQKSLHPVERSSPGGPTILLIIGHQGLLGQYCIIITTKAPSLFVLITVRAKRKATEFCCRRFISATFRNPNDQWEWSIQD